MITATYDLTGKTWAIDGEGTDFAVAFTDGDAKAIHPDWLRFGWLITVNGEQQDEKTFPPENAKYVEIKPTARFYGRVQALSEDDVSIVFNAATGDDQPTTIEHQFTVPRPPQPYPSWTWDDGWQPPVPYPDDEGFYDWDEDTLTWVEIPVKGS